MARPKIPIDENAVIAMAERGWSAEQIGAALKVSGDTIRRNYAEKIAIAKQHGAAKLIDILWQRAVTAKSDRVLCHLADRLLGKVATPVELGNQSSEGFKLVIEDYRKKDE